MKEDPSGAACRSRLQTRVIYWGCQIKSLFIIDLHAWERCLGILGKGLESDSQGPRSLGRIIHETIGDYFDDYDYARKVDCLLNGRVAFEKNSE